MFQYHPLHPLLVRDKCAQDTYTQALCHTLGVWIITRIYWMVVFAPHSIKSFFIGLLINGSAMMDKDEGRRGLERTGSNWNHGMSAGAGPGWAATLSDEPPEAVGGEMNGWTPSFSQHRNERESESVRGRVRHTFPAQEDDAQQDSRLPSNHQESHHFLLFYQVRWRWGGDEVAGSRSADGHCFLTSSICPLLCFVLLSLLPLNQLIDWCPSTLYLVLLVGPPVKVSFCFFQLFSTRFLPNSI